MSARRPWWHPATWAPVVLAVAVLAVVWQAVAVGHPYVLPRIPAVAHELASSPGAYLRDAGVTLQVALLGLVLGAGAGCLLAVAFSEVPVLRRALLPLTVVLNVTPVVALAPGLVVAFGFGPAPKVVVTAVVTFFPVLVNVQTGLRSAPEGPLQVLTSLRASRWEVLWRLRAPASLPYAVAALRVVLPLSVVGAVVAEFVAAGSSAGLGTLIATSAASSQLARVYAGIAVLALLGVLLLALVVLVERRVLFWHESSRRPLP